MYQKWIDTLLKLEFAHIKHSCPLFFPTFLWWLGKNYKTFEKERYKHFHFDCAKKKDRDYIIDFLKSYPLLIAYTSF